MTRSKYSSSQRTFIRNQNALTRMPQTVGRAACEGSDAFDVFADTDRVSQSVRNELARMCVNCPLTDCGWRQVYKPIGYAKKVAEEGGWA